MIQFNLLPWREQYRYEKKLAFVRRALVVSGVMLLIFVPVHYYHASHVKLQLAINQYITSEITHEHEAIQQLEKQRARKQVLMTQLNNIIALRTNNFDVIRLLNELVTIAPKVIYVEKMTRKGREIIFAGTAPSDEEVTKFVTALEAMTSLSKPELTIINKQTQTNRHYFELEAKLKSTEAARGKT